MQHIFEYITFENPQHEFNDACIMGDIEEVERLLKHSDVNPAKDRQSGLQHAIANSHSHIVKILLADERIDPTDSYHNFFQEACTLGDTESARALFETGAYNPAADNNYALKVANANANYETITFLLQIPAVLADAHYVQFEYMRGHIRQELKAIYGLDTDAELKDVLELTR